MEKQEEKLEELKAVNEYKETASLGHNSYTNELTTVMTASMITVQGQARTNTGVEKGDGCEIIS